MLLSLRLLVLLLLILAFANPFINRNAATLASNRLVLLVVDNSFSMRAGTRLADAKDAAMSVLSGKGAARAQVAAFGSQLRLMTQPIEDQSALRAAVQAIQPGDGHGNFGELARAVRAMAESVHTPIELHLFSDMQRSDLAATFSDMALPANVKLVTHAVVTKAQPNWTVESVDAPGQVWGKDAKPVHVQAVIAGYGTPAAQRTVSLVVNGKTTATKTVAVPANGRATVDFPALEVPYGFSRCEVKIDSADGFPGRRPPPLRRRAFRPAKGPADPQLRRQPFAALRRRRALGGRAIGLYPRIDQRQRGRRPQAVQLRFHHSLRSQYAALASRKFAHRVRALRRQSPHRRRHLRRRAARRFPFSARTSSRPATTAAFPIVTWRSARATPPTPPWPRPTAGRA